MKYSELIEELKTAGCSLLKHGSNHDIWYSPLTKNKFPVPRHQSHEVAKETERSIRKLAGI